MEPKLIGELRAALASAASEESVRAVVLAGRGTAFCAGADIDWMRRSAESGSERDHADAGELASLLHDIANLPKPVLARIQGAAIGGGVGLVAAADIAIAAPKAWFQLSEVRLGITPATISPFVIEAVGVRRARRLMLTGERFDAIDAWRMGLVAEVTPGEKLDERVDRTLDNLLAGAPAALAATKALVRSVANRPIDETLKQETVDRLIAIRESEEGREGLAAFLEKRRPRWRQ